MVKLMKIHLVVGTVWMIIKISKTLKIINEYYGNIYFRLCIDNTLCLVTAFDKIEAEHMLEKNKGIISKAEYYFVGVTSGVITINKNGNLTY